MNMRALRWYIARPRLAVAVAVVLTLLDGVTNGFLIRSAGAPSAAVAARAQHATTWVSNASLSESSVATLPDDSASCVWIREHHSC